MSSDSDVAAELADVVYNLELGYVQNYCAVATTALIFYEHLCTLPQEIERDLEPQEDWRHITIPTQSDRYGRSRLAMILTMPNWGTALTSIDVMERNSCKTVNLLLPSFQLLLSMIWAAFSALRVFAVSGRNWRLASFVFALSMVPVGTNLASDIRETYAIIEVPWYGPACDLTSLLSAKTSLTLLILTRACLIAADVFVLAVTWRNTYKIKKEASVMNMRTPTITLLLRDGAMLLVLNVLHLALEITNVHMTDDMAGSEPSFIASRASGLRFASAVVGNLGEHLEHGQTMSGSAVFQDTYAETEDGSDSDDIETPRDQWAPDSKPYEEERPSSQGDEGIATSA
ncbi:uncharacterized protein B0H18DRAFT_1008659 [Fomitopsis serialis]|uniref:uncharacterized protein n=1 Tax=Fomitopsis serialis TaxID=139415 RepID=UPI002007A315|nr:uncharacterized protein B0H18DRAFT_1008659 [Neoantrodia serialis]KAH9925482.1 hypothetical protein B0H18DRAFT_1008659 [Neoantrodia serialis]